MEWWQSGISALVGVLIGGLFTYVGLRKQLEQGKELDSRSWRRKVRGNPLFKLREELAVMAVKWERLVATVHPLQNKTEEVLKQELQEYLDDMNVYIQKGSFDNIRCMLADEEIINRVDEVIKDYRNSYLNMVNYKDSSAEEQTKAMEVFGRNKARIIEAQELINRKLEDL